MSDKVYTIKEIKEILMKMLEKRSVYRVILFGSYAKNCVTKNSDLDFMPLKSLKSLKIQN